MKAQVRYTDKIADTICERLASGQSLKSICDNKDMPRMASVFRWLADNEEFRDKYARAREAQAEAMAEEILEISDNATNDYMEAMGDEAGEAWRLNGEHIQRSRLRVDARKWVASKLYPKKYGERITTDSNVKIELDPEIAAWVNQG